MKEHKTIWKNIKRQLQKDYASYVYEQNNITAFYNYTFVSSKLNDFKTKQNESKHVVQAYGLMFISYLTVIKNLSVNYSAWKSREKFERLSS